MENGDPVCNPCGLYYKLNGVSIAVAREREREIEREKEREREVGALLVSGVVELLLKTMRWGACVITCQDNS